jgi:hypothetical protein
MKKYLTFKNISVGVSSLFIILIISIMMNILNVLKDIRSDEETIIEIIEPLKDDSLLSLK